jgi:hypothetical protein
MQVGPYIPVGIPLKKAAVRSTSWPTRRLSHFEGGAVVRAGGEEVAGVVQHLGFGRIVVLE